MHSFKPVKDGIYIGPQPSAQDLDAAKQQGIKTVIDFRMPSETVASNETLTTKCGLDYVNIPVNKAGLDAHQISELEAVISSREGPFLLHCATGTRAALLLLLSTARKNGWTREQVFAEAQAMGFDLKTSPEFSSFVAQTIA